MIKTITIKGRKIEYDLNVKPIKRTYIRVKSNGRVSVSANARVSLFSIEQFILNNGDFILKNLDKYDRLDKENPSLQYVSGEKVRLFGKDTFLTVKEGAKNEALFDFDGITLTVKDDGDFILKERTMTKFLNSALENFVIMLCRSAYKDFTSHCTEFPTVKFRKMRSRWGSCNPNKNIVTFNYQLIKADESAIRYVVYHEFCHFIHANHSPAFYGELKKFIPDWKEEKKKLNKIKI